MSERAASGGLPGRFQYHVSGGSVGLASMSHMEKAAAPDQTGRRTRRTPMATTACGEPIAARAESSRRVAGSAMLRAIRRRLLGIDPREVMLVRRGVTAVDSRAGARLEQIGETFVSGYHAALESADDSELAQRLEAVERERRGFAYEGAAMALYLLDALTPWNRSRWQRFVNGPGNAHAYMIHVGAGWAMARLPMGIGKSLSQMDSLLRWLAIDGWAFHDAYFHPARTVQRGERPRRLRGHALRAWDMGLGRGLWFALGADVPRIAEQISAMNAERRADLWSGVGLACAYAGGVESTDIELLCALAVEHRFWLGQGASFAAKARQRAGNPADHTDLACRLLCGLSAETAAQITDACLEKIAPDDGDGRAFDAWRAAIAARLREVVA